MNVNLYKIFRALVIVLLSLILFAIIMFIFFSNELFDLKELLGAEESIIETIDPLADTKNLYWLILGSLNILPILFVRRVKSISIEGKTLLYPWVKKLFVIYLSGMVLIFIRFYLPDEVFPWTVLLISNVMITYKCYSAIKGLHSNVKLRRHFNFRGNLDLLHAMNAIVNKARSEPTTGKTI